MNQNNNTRISIQVGLSGYSFRLESGGQPVRSSDWMSADRVFTEQEFTRIYEDVQISLFTPKSTLVPVNFYDPESLKDILSSVCSISESDVVDAVEVPELGAVLVYSNDIGENLSKLISEMVHRNDGAIVRILPEHYYMLKALDSINDYNKIIASYSDGYLYLVVAQGKSLQLCNSFKVPDFTTAEYFIFLALKKLQLNPEVSSIYFRTQLEQEQEMSLYRYFKSVEVI